jgi:hypothetical protein
MGAVPVHVEKVAVVQPHPLAPTLKVNGFAPERAPQGLQVRVAQASGGFEGFGAEAWHA